MYFNKESGTRSLSCSVDGSGPVVREKRGSHHAVPVPVLVQLLFIRWAQRVCQAP